MGRNKTGFTAETKKHLLLGAGAIFKNFAVGVDTYESALAAGKAIGATQGGNEFKAAPSVHNIQIDGILGKAADLDVIDSWDVSLAVGFIEANKGVICAALGASTVDTATSNAYDIIKGDTEFKASDYLENVTFIGTLSGSETPVIIQVYNAINMGGLSVKFEDGQEGVINVTFEGRNTTSDMESAPFAIFYPKGTDAKLDIVDKATVAAGATVVLPVGNVTGTLSAVSGTQAKATVEVAGNGYVIVTGVAAGTSVITVSDGSADTDTCTVTVVA